MTDTVAIDTVAISKSFRFEPDIDLLIKNGCIPRYSANTGQVYKLVLNSEPDAKEPRLTISKSPQRYWILKAEVSIGAWFNGSNIYLPTEANLRDFFPLISDFVYFKTGIEFDAEIERCTRFDVTRDFRSGDVKMRRVLRNLINFDLPKYDRKTINDTGVYFENKGKEKNKRFCFYDKYADLLEKGASIGELEQAKGVLRFEIQHKNSRSVSNLAKSLGFCYHDALRMISADTSNIVIEKSMKLFNLKSLLESDESKLEILAREYESSMPLLLAGHTNYKDNYGINYGQHLGINLKPQTIMNYDRLCKRVGVISLYE